MADLFNPKYPDPPVVLKVPPKACKECGKPFVPVSKTGMGASHCPDCRRKHTEKARATRVANKAAQVEQAPAIETPVQWYKPEEKLPEKSGNYLVYTYSGLFMDLPYSTTFMKFNVLEGIHRTQKEADEAEIRVVLWADYPKAITNYGDSVRASEHDAELAKQMATVNEKEGE